MNASWSLSTFLVWYLVQSSVGPNNASSPTQRTTTAKFGLETNDIEELQLHNMGKSSFHLPTEDANLMMMQLVDSANVTDKSEQTEKIILDDGDSWGQKYVTVSGEEEREVNVDSVVTPALEESTSTKHTGDIQGFIKMFVRKKSPGPEEHKINVIETNKMTSMLKPKPKRNHRSQRNWFDVPLSRPKRTKGDPLLKFLKGEFTKDNFDESFNDKTNSGTHTIKFKKLFNENKNTRISKNNYGVTDFDRGLKSHFNRETHNPWIRTDALEETPFKSREAFQKNTNSYKKHNSLKNWRKPQTYKPVLDEDSEYPIENVRKNNDIFEQDGYEPLFPWSSILQVYPQAEPIRKSHSKRSRIIKISSTVHPKPTDDFRALSTENSATPIKTENYSHISKAVTSSFKPDLNSLLFDKSASFSSERNKEEATPNSLLTAITISFICFFCISFTLISCSFVRRNPSPSTVQLRGAHVTFNVTTTDDRRHVPFRSHSGSFVYKKTAADDDDLESDFADLEWQSEAGEWLMDQGPVRNAITFEKLL